MLELLVFFLAVSLCRCLPLSDRSLGEKKRHDISPFLILPAYRPAELVSGSIANRIFLRRKVVPQGSHKMGFAWTLDDHWHYAAETGNTAKSRSPTRVAKQSAIILSCSIDLQGFFSVFCLYSHTDDI